jgi:hypothetical protein
MPIRETIPKNIPGIPVAMLISATIPKTIPGIPVRYEKHIPDSPSTRDATAALLVRAGS